MESGLVSEDGADRMNAKWPNYVPFLRVMDNPEERTGVSNKVADQGAPIKKLKGSGRDIIDPIERIVINTYAYMNMAQRNRVTRSLADLAEARPGKGRLVEKVPPKMAPVANVSLDEMLTAGDI